MSQKSRLQSNQESSSNASPSTSLAAATTTTQTTPNATSSLITPVILITNQSNSTNNNNNANHSQASPTPSSTSSSSQHNQSPHNISSTNTNLTNSTLPLPNTSSHNSSLTTSVSSSMLVSSSSSSSTSSLSNNLNQTSVSSNSNSNEKHNSKRALFTKNDTSNIRGNPYSSSLLIATTTTTTPSTPPNTSSSNQNELITKPSRSAATASLLTTVNSTSSSNVLGYTNDASILSTSNKSVSNSNLSLEASAINPQLSPDSKNNSISISLNFYNDQQVGSGHFFTKKTFHKPTYCHHCTEMLWGLIGQGFVCEVCNFVSHEKCQKSIVSPCSSIAHSLIKNPVPHCWSEPTHFKRKFCNICRKRLDDQFAVRCEICEYYIHTDCQVLAVNDCCETATYVPNRNLNSVTHHHHWREGNLPFNSKCSVCRKSCWTYECLAGMKCEWCGITTHSICRTRVEDECNFGVLRDIIVPPYAVSVPRIDMNKETILGIPTNRSKARSNSSEWTVAADFKADPNSESSLHSPFASNHQTSKTFNLSPTIQNSNNNTLLNHDFSNNNNNNSHDNSNFSLTTPSSSSSTSINNANIGSLVSIPSFPQAQPALATTNLSVQPNVSSSSSSSPSPIGLGTNIGNHNSTLITTTTPLSSPNQLISSTKTNNNNNNNNNNNLSQSSNTFVVAAGSGSSKKKDKSKQQADDEEDKEVIKVYDGNASFRKRLFKFITVSKSANYTAIVEASLRTFHISDDPNRFYITVPLSAASNLIVSTTNTNTTNTTATTPTHSSSSSSYSPSNLDDYQIEELVVDETNPIKSIKSALFNSNNLDGAKPSIILRYKDSESESIRIYQVIIKESSSYQRVTINLKSTVLDTIQMALDKFQMNKKNNTVDKFSLVEVLLDHNVTERILNPNEFPLQVIRKLRKESLCNNRMVRFYLQQKEDPHGPSVALFVSNLPAGLSQIQYEKILMDTLKNNNEIRWNKFDVIYYEYGSMVILYDDSEKAVKAYKVLKDSVYENKQLTVLLLPTIQHQMIPPNVCPLLVFVNVKSGGKQGAELVTSFRHLLNPHQVFDLQNGGPLPGLYVFRNIESYRILACGGDGTIGWVLSCLDNVSQDAKCQSPPMAIVPLGTGNDLARVLRWGAGYTGAEEPINLLRDVIDAEEISLDRWTVVFHPDENKELDDIKKQVQIAVNVSQSNTNEDNTEIYVMNNYFGIGIEADVCLDFHTAREQNPDKFNSRLNNKKFYLQLGIRKMMNKGSCRDFNRYVTLEVDGRRVDLPQIEGIIILNILSWGSGSNPWGSEKDDVFQKPTHYDGMLEVVGIRGFVHMGQIQGGLSNAIRLAQGGRIKIRMNSDIPVHVDGEPWLQTPCAITILKSALKATMLKKSKIKMKRRNTEPNINAPIAPNNSSESSGNRAETDPVDPEGESEPY